MHESVVGQAQKEIVALRHQIAHLANQHAETDRLSQLQIQVLNKELATWQAKCELRDAQIEVLKNQQKRITTAHPEHISPRLLNFYLSPQMPHLQSYERPSPPYSAPIEVKYEPKEDNPFGQQRTSKHARDPNEETPKPSRKKSRVDPNGALAVHQHHSRPHRMVFRSRTSSGGSQKQRVLRALRSLPDMSGTSNMIQKLCPELTVAAVSTCLSKMRINGQVTGEMQENTRKRIWKLKAADRPASREGSARTPTPPAHSNAGQTPFHHSPPPTCPPTLEAVPTPTTTAGAPTGLRNRTPKPRSPQPPEQTFIPKLPLEKDPNMKTSSKSIQQQRLLTPMPISNRRTPSPQKILPKFLDGPVSRRPIARPHTLPPAHGHGSFSPTGSCGSSEENFQP